MEYAIIAIVALIMGACAITPFIANNEEMGVRK